MKRALSKETMGYLVEVSGELDRTLAFLEKKEVNPDVKAHLQDVLHDLKACLLDGKDICRLGIAQAKLAG